MTKRLPLPDVGVLRDLYIDQHLTQRQVSERLGVSQPTVGHWLIHYQIPRRCQDGDGEMRYRGRVYVYQPDHPRTHGNYYVRRAILVWEQSHGRPFPRGHVGHHLNLVKDDGRPENILPMTNSQHSYLHSLLRKLATLWLLTQPH